MFSLIPYSPLHHLLNPTTQSYLLFDELLEPHPCELPDPDDFELEFELGDLDDVGLLSGVVEALDVDVDVMEMGKEGFGGVGVGKEDVEMTVEGEEGGEWGSEEEEKGMYSPGSFSDDDEFISEKGYEESESDEGESDEEMSNSNSENEGGDEERYYDSTDDTDKTTSDSLSIYSLDTTQPLEYLTTSPSFPASAPLGHPHIIHTDTFSEDTDDSDLTLADGIATFLYQWNWTELDRFFGRRDGEFKEKAFWVDVRSKERSRWGWDKGVVIGRQGDEVMAGLRSHKGEFENFVTFRVTQNGKWEPVSSTGMCSFGNKPKNVEREGAYIASAILMYRRWDRRKNEISCSSTGRSDWK